MSPARRPTPHDLARDLARDLGDLARDLAAVRPCCKSLCGAAAAELCRGATPGPPAAPHPAPQGVHRHADREQKTVGPPLRLLIERARRTAQAFSQKVESARVCARPGGSLSGSPARL